MTLRIASLSIAGVADADSTGRAEARPIPAEPIRNSRRLGRIRLVAQSAEKGDDILDLFGREDRVAGIGGRHVGQILQCDNRAA